MAVNDIALWQKLARSDLHSTELVPLLTALADEVLPNRWFFLGSGHVGRLLADPSPEVRAAAIRCYAGATGVTAWPRLIEACEDPDARVRQAALAALQVSAAEDPVRWIHILLGSDRDQIPMALRHLPRGFPRTLLFPLLAEERHRAAVLEAIGPLSMPEYTAHLLAATDAGHLPPEVVLQAVAKLPWERAADTILGTLTPGRSWPAESFATALATDSSPNGLRQALESSPFQDPPLDQLLNLGWDEVTRDDHLSIGGRILAWLATCDCDLQVVLRLAAGLARQALRRRQWTAPLVATCGAAFPMLLEDDSIPPAQRDEGIALMRLFLPPPLPEWWQASLRRLLNGDVFRGGATGIHLRRLGSFPIPCPPWQVPGAEGGWREQIREAIRADAAGAVCLLHRSHDWSPESRSELVALVEEGWNAELALALAEWACSHPLSAMTTRDWLSPAHSDDVFRSILARLDREPEAIGRRECELLSEEIMRRVTPGNVLDLLAILLHLPEPSQHVLGRRLLHAVARHDMLAWALEEEPWSFTVRGPDRASGRGGKPVPIADVLRAGERQAYLALLTADETTGVIELCAEEREQLGRVHPDALNDALGRYLGRPCRGVVSALRNRKLQYADGGIGIYWALVLASHDPPSELCLAAAHSHIIPLVLVRDEVKKHLASFDQWSLYGGLLAWYGGPGDPVKPCVRAELQKAGTSPADLVLSALQQPSEVVLRAVLEAVEALARPAAEEGRRSGSVTLDRRTSTVLCNLLWWMAGGRRPDSLPPPLPELEAELFASRFGSQRNEEQVVKMLPSEVVAEVEGLTARLTWDAAEHWRNRFHRHLSQAPEVSPEHDPFGQREDWSEMEDGKGLGAAEGAVWSDDPSAVIAAAALEGLDAAVRDPDPAVYHPAIRFLLQQPARDPRVAELLRCFLDCGTGRNHELRVEAAGKLMEASCRDGVPVLLGAEVEIFGRNPLMVGLGALTDGELESVVDAALIAGPGVLERRMLDPVRNGLSGIVPWLPLGLSNCGLTRTQVSRLLLRIVADSGDKHNREEALRILRARGIEHPAVRRLAELLWWGTCTGIRLTGQRFSVDLLADDNLGFTSLDERRIHVNPLPLLRGTPNGDLILQGLMVHELGHHLYHASARGQAAARQAHDEGLGGVLNLVWDEHLERNLRGRDPFFGECFSHLTAFAFRHSCREVPVDTLMDSSRGWAVDQLIGLPLKAARERGHVLIDFGGVLRQLEQRGNSTVRFIRALRMGLGNRSGDPKVAQALALFGKGFRQTSVEEHLSICRRLRELFGDELQVIRAMQLDASLPASAAELLGSVVSRADVAAALRRMLGQGSGSGTTTTNRESEEVFDELTRVVPLRHSPQEHCRLARVVSLPARQLRRRLSRLGLDGVAEKRRVLGTRLDRSRLGQRVLTGDPRILERRRRRPAADLFLGLVVDCSGSMAGDGKIERARLVATMVAEACRNLPGVELRIFGFTDSVVYDAGTAATCAAHAFSAGGGNNDAGALWHAAQQAMRSRRTARLLLMVSDGCPTECSVAALRALVLRLTRRHGLACAQVAVEPLRDICFPDYIEVREADGLGAASRFGEVLARLSSRAIGRM